MFYRVFMASLTHQDRKQEGSSKVTGWLGRGRHLRKDAGSKLVPWAGDLGTKTNQQAERRQG